MTTFNKEKLKKSNGKTNFDKNRVVVHKTRMTKFMKVKLKKSDD